MTTSYKKALLSLPPDKKRKKEKSSLVFSQGFIRIYFAIELGFFFLWGPVLQGFLHYSARKAMRILVRGETSFGSEVER